MFAGYVFGICDCSSRTSTASHLLGVMSMFKSKPSSWRHVPLKYTPSPSLLAISWIDHCDLSHSECIHTTCFFSSWDSYGQTQSLLFYSQLGPRAILWTENYFRIDIWLRHHFKSVWPRAIQIKITLALINHALDGPRPHTWYVDGPRQHTSNKWPQATNFKLMAPGHTL